MSEVDTKITAISKGYKVRVTDCVGQETVLGPFPDDVAAQTAGQQFAAREYPMGGVESIRTFPACTHLVHDLKKHGNFCPSCGDPIN